VDHAGKFAEFGDKLCAFLLSDVAERDGTQDLRACFSSRSFGETEELLEFGFAGALGTFGDIVGDAVSGAGNLVFEPPRRDNRSGHDKFLCSMHVIDARHPTFQRCRCVAPWLITST